VNEDLLNRLRDRGVCSIDHNSCRNDLACEQAADRIERLQQALSDAEYLLVEACVQLREGKVKTRRNRAELIEDFLSTKRAVGVL